MITGVGGDDEHTTQFHQWATTIIDAAKERGGLADATITYLADKPDIAPGRIAARSTRDNVQKTFADLAAKAQAADEVFIVLIGHGSFDGKRRGVQPVGARSHGRGLRQAGGEAPGPADRLRQHVQLERRISRAARRARPHHRHRDQDRRRAQRNAVRAVFRRGVQGQRGRHRSQRPRVGDRSLRVRENQGRRDLHEGRPHPHRARHARRRPRGEVCVDAVSRVGARQGGRHRAAWPTRSCGRCSTRSARSRIR